MNERPGSRTAGWRGLLTTLLMAGASCGGAEIPEIPPGEMESAVIEALRNAREALAADRGNPGAWGRFGMVLHAHRLPRPPPTGARPASPAAIIAGRICTAA